MRVVVVGASGFLGRHILAALASRGLETVATSRSGAVAQASAGQETLALDLAAPPADPFAALGRPDVVVHLAWGGLPNYRSLHHFETELPAQYAFLAALARGGLRRLVVAGTCFEYGMASGPLDEALQPAPANPYGYAKNALREQLGHLQAQTGLALVWARLFYLYGEGQGARSLHSQLRAAVAAGERSFPMSGGEQLRDFLDVREAARLLVALALHAGNVGVVNVCSGRPVSVRGLVEHWIRENGWDIVPDLGRYPYPDYEPFAFWGDRGKLDRLLGPAANEEATP
ncbi:NAD(P)-dependent oxidoreductase [Salinarimonas sp.]|uniref:NAD-dependent epimerase/dehydratase family protein n=1 Tax=Salinarimonas sp. TaxID=2766526 RepID=UPI0032D97E95